MIYNNALYKKPVLLNCLFCCSKDKTLLFFPSPSTNFLEPMTHEVLSTLTPSEGSSNEVEEAGEVFCPQSNTSALLDQLPPPLHVLSCLLRRECFSSFSIRRVWLWVGSRPKRLILVQVRHSFSQSQWWRPSPGLAVWTFLSLRQICSTCWTCWIHTIYHGVWRLRLL